MKCPRCGSNKVDWLKHPSSQLNAYCSNCANVVWIEPPEKEPMNNPLTEIEREKRRSIAYFETIETVQKRLMDCWDQNDSYETMRRIRSLLDYVDRNLEAIKSWDEE